MVKKWTKWLLKKLFWGGLHHFLTDKQYAKYRYWLELDKPLNIEYPEGFTEKIQYIKLFRHNDLRQIAANRTEVREFVSDKIGEQYLIPLIGIYEKLTPQVWQSLPKQFVLKANHGSGMLYITRKKMMRTMGKYDGKLKSGKTRIMPNLAVNGYTKELNGHL